MKIIIISCGNADENDNNYDKRRGIGTIRRAKKGKYSPKKCDDTSECSINHSLPYFILFPLEGKRGKVLGDEGGNTARFSGYDCTP